MARATGEIVAAGNDAESETPHASHETNRWLQLDIGEVLPGCSVPIHVEEVGDGTHRYKFALQNVEPWSATKLTRTEQARLAEDIPSVLAGLKTLHSNQIFYGRISNATFLRRGDGREQKPVIVVNPEIAAQTSEVIGGHEEEKYWLPDRIRSDRKVRGVDDLYALGVCLSELLIGSSRVEKIWNGTQDKALFADKLLRNVRVSRGNFRLKRLTLWLIASIEHEDRTAEGAIRYLKRLSVRSEWFKKALFAVVAIAFLGYSYYWMKQDGVVADSEIERLTAELTEMEGNVERRNAKIAELKSEQENLLAIIADRKPAADASKIARENWSNLIAGGTLRETIESADRYLESNSSGSDREQIQQWLAGLTRLSAEAKNVNAWFAENQALRKRLLSVIYRPWDNLDAIDVIAEQVEELNEAHSTWKEWAASSKTLDELLTQQSLMPAGAKKDALGKWLNEIHNLTSLDFRFSGGEASTPWGTQHLVTVEAGPSSVSKVKWDWQSSDSSGTSINVRISDYVRGAPIHVYLEKHDGYLFYDTNVIDKAFAGPLAPWKLTKPVRLLNEAEGYKMTVEIKNDVGPPHLADRASLSPPTASDAAKDSLPASPTSTSLEKPVYDPTSQIPLNR